MPKPPCPIGPTCTGCAKCDPEYHQKRAARALQLRTAVPHEYAPPDPYKADIDAQRAIDARAAAKRTYQPAALRPTEIPTDGTPPDPYKAGLERLREENR